MHLPSKVALTGSHWNLMPTDEPFSREAPLSQHQRMNDLRIGIQMERSDQMGIDFKRRKTCVSLN